jgi:hypothetical protein
MRTIDRLSSNAFVARLGRVGGRVRRALMARPPAVRLALVLAPVLALTAAGYWAAGTLGSTGPRHLAGGRPFASDDLIAIFNALDAKNIWYRPDADRRVAVLPEQYDQAVKLVAGLNVGPRPFSELRESPGSLNDLLLTPEDRQQRDRLRSEKMIERLINNLPGVVWSFASIRHPRPTLMRHSRINPSAFVWLECEPNRPLPLQTIQAIPSIVTGASDEPELSADAIRVMDKGGRVLLDPHNPNLGRETRARVREQELRDRVADLLSWINGVRILLVPGDRSHSAPPPAQAEPATGEPARPSPGIAVNEPAGLDELPPLPDPAVVEKAEGGRLYVYVPRSYYYLARPQPDHREPTLEELQQVAAKTKERVERMLKPPIVPEAWTVEVDTMPDEVPATRAAGLPAGADHRRIAADWGIVGAVAATVALLMATGSWIQAARRPGRPIEPSPAGRRYREDLPDEPEPSERVRELVRRDPEVAASVLQRWAIQGGRAS